MNRTVCIAFCLSAILLVCGGIAHAREAGDLTGTFVGVNDDYDRTRVTVRDENGDDLVFVLTSFSNVGVDLFNMAEGTPIRIAWQTFDLEEAGSGEMVKRKVATRIDPVSPNAEEPGALKLEPWGGVDNKIKSFSLGLKNNSEKPVGLLRGEMVLIFTDPAGNRTEHRLYGLTETEISPGEDFLIDDNPIVNKTVGGKILYLIYNQEYREGIDRPEDKQVLFIPSAMPPGKYRIRPVLRLEDGSEISWNEREILFSPWESETP